MRKQPMGKFGSWSSGQVSAWTVFRTPNPEHRGVPEGSSGLGLEHPWLRGQRRRKSVHWSVPGWLLPAAAPSPIPARYMAGQPVPHGYWGVVDTDLPRSLAPYLPSSPQNACFPLGLPCSTQTRVPQSLSSQETLPKPGSLSTQMMRNYH